MHQSLLVERDVLVVQRGVVIIFFRRCIRGKTLLLHDRRSTSIRPLSARRGSLHLHQTSIRETSPPPPSGPIRETTVANLLLSSASAQLSGTFSMKTRNLPPAGEQSAKNYQSVVSNLGTLGGQPSGVIKPVVDIMKPLILAQ